MFPVNKNWGMPHFLTNPNDGRASVRFMDLRWLKMSQMETSTTFQHILYYIILSYNIIYIYIIIYWLYIHYIYHYICHYIYHYIYHYVHHYIYHYIYTIIYTIIYTNIYMYVYHCILYISPFPCAVFIFTRRFQCFKCGQLLHRTDKDQRRQDTFGLGTQHHEPSHGEVVRFSNCDTQNITKSSPSGWWLSHPSEKYESQLGLLFPIYTEKQKPVPNHQPDIYLMYPSVWVELFRCKLNKCTIGVLGQSVGLPKFWREGSRSQRHSLAFQSPMFGFVSAHKTLLRTVLTLRVCVMGQSAYFKNM